MFYNELGKKKSRNAVADEFTNKHFREQRINWEKATLNYRTEELF